MSDLTQSDLITVLSEMYKKPCVETIAPVLQASYSDPSLFNSAILGGDPFWGKQLEMSRLVVNHNTSLILSGNAVGKTWWLSRIVLWYLYTRPKAVVITTASSYAQLASGLWGNIRSAFANSLIPLGGTITSSPGASQQILRLSNDHFAVGVSTTSTERFAGIRSAVGNTLVCVDEASGMSAAIWEGVTSLAADKVVLIGNPLHAHGPFYEQFQKAQDPANRIGWLRVTSMESPDIALEKSPRGMACATWLHENEVAWGKGGWWSSHVLAQFPTDSDSALIPGDWLTRTNCPHKRSGPVRMAIDLALGKSKLGDNTVILVRDDNGVIEISASNRWELGDTATEVYRLMRKHSVQPRNVVFDANGPGNDFNMRLHSVGIVGAREYVGSRGLKSAYYGNWRTACAYAVRRRLDPDRKVYVPQPQRVNLSGNKVISPPASEVNVMDFPDQFSIPTEYMLKLRPQLTALTYENINLGKVKLIPREEVKARIGCSPDYADALLISFAYTD